MKRPIRHGNSAAPVLDKALLDILNARMDTPLEVTTDGRNLIVSPQNTENAEADLLEALEKINRRHGSVLRRLGQQRVAPRFLIMSDVLLIAQDQMRRYGGTYGVRDPTLLSSALAMPSATFEDTAQIAERVRRLARPEEKEVVHPRSDDQDLAGG